MIYITGDCHGDYRRFNSDVFSEQKQMKKEVFTIENKKFFTFGGAASHDIQDGILEKDDPEFKQKKKLFDSLGLLYRINHISWWKEEMPSEEEYETGLNNLETAEWKVDFMVSHCCPSNVQALLSGGLFKLDGLTDYFERISQRLKFKKWLFGHYHDNRQILGQYIGLYEQIIRIV